MFGRSADLLSFPTFEMPDVLNFRDQAPHLTQRPPHTPDDRASATSALCLILFNVVKTENGFFFSLYFSTLQYLCAFSFFSLLNLKGTALCMFIN